MNSEEGTLYMIRHASAEEADDEWATPEPAEAVVVDAVTAAGNLDAPDVDDLSSYVEFSALAAVLEGDEDEVTFTVEGHEVVVTGDGEVHVTVE